MNHQPERSQEEIENAVAAYADTLFRVCLSMLRNPMDAEDMVQETFLKFSISGIVFPSEAQKKAWLIKVAVNLCKNQLSFFQRHKLISLEDLSPSLEPPSDSNEGGALLEALLSLPPKYRIVLTLYYVEEYTVREIALILHLHESSVKRRLITGRTMLQKSYREEF